MARLCPFTLDERMRTCVRPMVVCVLLSRFALIAALGERRALLAEPIALAPEPGGTQHVGEVSAAAEAFGVLAGMRLGAALPRRPGLRPVPPDPGGRRGLWDQRHGRPDGGGAGGEADPTGPAVFWGGG